MKRFKVGYKFINNIDHSKVSSNGYDHIKNYKQYNSEPDESLETIGKVQTIIKIEDDEVISDFILSSGNNYYFEKGSSYAMNCEKIKKDKL